MEDDDIKRLSGLFEKLGAKDPDDWASSQISEGTPQLARFLFLRQAWRNIVSSEDPSWIEAAIREFKEDPSVPYGGVGWALGAL